MKNCFVFGLLLLVNSLVAQGYKRYDITLKIGKAGFKIFCLKLSSRNSNLFQFLFHFDEMGPKTKI